MNRPDLNIMLMLTYSGLTVIDDKKEERRMVNEEVTKFIYPEIVAYYYRYIGEVENNNVLMHDDGTKS